MKRERSRPQKTSVLGEHDLNYSLCPPAKVALCFWFLIKRQYCWLVLLKNAVAVVDSESACIVAGDVRLTSYNFKSGLELHKCSN